MLDLPIRVDVATGDRLPPTGLDPYALPWVQGAAQTVPLAIRHRYPDRVADLREKQSVLRTKRGLFDPEKPLYGPQRRSAEFRALDQRPGDFSDVAFPRWPE